jgi:hypothetical protein
LEDGGQQAVRRAQTAGGGGAERGFANEEKANRKLYVSTRGEGGFLYRVEKIKWLKGEGLG